MVRLDTPEMRKCQSIKPRRYLDGWVLAGMLNANRIAAGVADNSQLARFVRHPNVRFHEKESPARRLAATKQGVSFGTLCPGR